MKKSLKNAIATAKRNIFTSKYDQYTVIEDVIIKYTLRKDEIQVMIDSLNKWIIRNPDKIWAKTYTDFDVRCFLRNM